MIKSRLGLCVLCVFTMPLLFSGDIVLWEFGIVIQETPQVEPAQQPEVLPKISEKELGNISQLGKMKIGEIPMDIRKQNTTSLIKSGGMAPTPEPTYSNAKQAILTGRYKEAVEIYAQLSSSNLHYNYWHAIALFRLSQNNEALALIHLAATVDDEMLFLKGNIYKQLHDPVNALGCFKTLLTDYPKSDYASISKIQIAMLENKKQ